MNFRYGDIATEMMAQLKQEQVSSIENNLLTFVYYDIVSSGKTEVPGGS